MTTATKEAREELARSAWYNQNPALAQYVVTALSYTMSGRLYPCNCLSLSDCRTIVDNMSEAERETFTGYTAEPDYTGTQIGYMDTESLVRLMGNYRDNIAQVTRDHAENWHPINVCLHDTQQYKVNLAIIHRAMIMRAANGDQLAAAYVVADRDAYLASLPKCVTCHDPIQVGAKWCEIHSPQDD